MSRPEALFSLFATLETLDGVGPKSATLFASLGVTRPKDLLFLLPQSGIDRQRRLDSRCHSPRHRHGRGDGRRTYAAAQ